MSMATLVVLWLASCTSSVALSLGFDININCARACGSIHECSGDPPTHNSYCKYWQNPPICFGIYLRPDGTPCFQPAADPSCDDRVLAMLGCDGNIAYPPGVSTYPSDSIRTHSVQVSSTTTPSSLRASATPSTRTSSSAYTTVLPSTVTVTTYHSSLSSDEIVTTGRGSWTTTEHTENRQTREPSSTTRDKAFSPGEKSTSMSSMPQISSTTTMSLTVKNDTAIPKTSDTKTTVASATVEPRSTATLPDAFTTFAVGTVILHPSN
ncbi:hypothetical protein FOL47_001592 [Perkinsus chesapeaki]|uniref:Uncharacterized protein n=1 Tax=Perkinsus chesapeaki TaxID=330153 RepID=A0A7J6MI44_PERCH|nr:hypothetical protein FOL47_001592 [Perkinsus chesapeaki]